MQIPLEKLSAEQRGKLMQYFCSIAPQLSTEQAEIEKLREQIRKYNTTLVMQERKVEHFRPTYVHTRGEFLRPTDPVTPELLSLFAPLRKDVPHNRLALARWLVSRDNPLVGRVTVNRQWQAIFGRGIVRTTEDFGYQGDPPTHPELLDWLAFEFMNQGWSLKKLHKLILMSATYQQSSVVSPELLAADPQNLLLGRAPRVRLEAELVRDSLLRMSGLLSRSSAAQAFSRRSLPASPPKPRMASSPGTSATARTAIAAVCTPSPSARRPMRCSTRSTPPAARHVSCAARSPIRRSKPLRSQNDVVAVEVAQALGQTMANDSRDLDSRLVSLFRRCLTRPPSANELDLLKKFYSAQEDRLRHGELDGAKIIGDSGKSATPDSIAAPRGLDAHGPARSVCLSSYWLLRSRCRARDNHGRRKAKALQFDGYSVGPSREFAY